MRKTYSMQTAACSMKPVLVSCVLCLVSCVLCLVSCVLCLVSCVLCLVSCVLCPVSCVLCLVSCISAFRLFDCLLEHRKRLANVLLGVTVAEEPRLATVHVRLDATPTHPQGDALVQRGVCFQVSPDTGRRAAGS